MLTINKRFGVIDGWIVDVEERQIVPPTFIERLTTADDRKKLAEVENLKFFGNIDTSESVIVNSTSEELFNHVKTDDIEFVTLPGRVVKRNSRPHIDDRESASLEFTLNCHRIRLGSENECYLHFSFPGVNARLQSRLYGVPIKLKITDRIIFNVFVKLQKLNFTREDYKILKNLVSNNNSHAKIIAGDMMKILKAESSKQSIGFFGHKIYRGSDNFIKDLLPEVLASYGAYISYLLLVLKHCDKLSIFSRYKATAKRVVEILRDCHTATELAEAIGKEVSVLSSGGGEMMFWMTWIFLGAFDFCSWRDYEHKCPFVSILDYRYLLESIMWLFRFGGVLYGEDRQAVVESWAPPGVSSLHFVTPIKNLHRRVSNEAEIASLTFANVNHEEHFVTVKNRVLSYRIIGGALSDLRNNFDSCVNNLSRWLNFGDFHQLHSITIGSHGRTFEGDESVVSILHNFGSNAFQHVKMRWRVAGNKNDANILNQVKELINHLHELLMVMVWISTGISMRYPELAALTYAGSSRNIFIDNVKRRLYLRIKYSKNHKFTDRILFLTGDVSKRLWWAIAILSTFAFVTFYDEIDMYDESEVMNELCRDVFEDIKREELPTDNEDSITRFVSSNSEVLRQVRQAICTNSATVASLPKMFAFVDIKNHRLIGLSQARNVLKITKRRTKPSHQNMLALWNNFIIPKLNLDAEINSSEDGNSTTRIGRQTATVSRFSKGRELTFDEMSAAHNLFQKEIDAAIDKRKGSKDSNHS